MWKELEELGIRQGSLEYEALLDEIRQDVELGVKAGVKGTPTFFIGGVKIGAGLSVENLEQALANVAGRGKP